MSRLASPVGRAILGEDAGPTVANVSVGVDILGRVSVTVRAMAFESQFSRLGRDGASPAFNDFCHLVSGLWASIASTLGDHIRRVGRYISHKQVVGSNAQGRVAVVAGHLTRTEGNPGPFKRQAVDIQGATATLYDPITATGSRALPQPAAVCLLNLRPEPRLDWLGVASHLIHCTARPVR